jgi:hypothetical protein
LKILEGVRREKEVGEKPEGGRREAGGRPEGGQREAEGRLEGGQRRPEGGQREARGRPEGGQREAEGRPQGGKRETKERPEGKRMEGGRREPEGGRSVGQRITEEEDRNAPQVSDGAPQGVPGVSTLVLVRKFVDEPFRNSFGSQSPEKLRQLRVRRNFLSFCGQVSDFYSTG